MVNVDMWYGNKIEEVEEVSTSFYGNEGKYRGNIYIQGKTVGDYVADDSVELEKKFPQLVFNWGD